MSELELLNNMNAGYFFILSMTVLLFAHFSAFFAGKYCRKFSMPVPSEIIPNNILALLALILGFSFSMVINRYEFKRELGIKEGSAIETAYLRSRLLKDVDHKILQELFLKYVNTRIQTYHGKSQDKVFQKITDVEKEIWENAKLITDKHAGHIEEIYVRSLNDMFDTANERTYVLFKKLNIGFYLLILILASTAFGIISFDRGLRGHESYKRHAVFIVLFCMVFSFIFDLDHFRTGLIQMGQDPILKAREVMLQYEI